MSEIDRIKELQKMSQQELIEIILKLEKDKVHNERGAGRKSKFNKKQIKQIELERSKGKSIRAIAKEFDCSPALIHKIIHQGWYNDDIDALRRKVELREKTIKDFGFIKEGETYKEWEQMKAHLKELEEKQRSEQNSKK
ncbi:helix-turn-helix domain-containing protein [Intestinibacter sp.]|uniref:helix-turn-helix domain-containing protein n=1 Tax=Intestinibacter sp. TaxID=1965304 RepID=UPI003F145294